MLSNYLFICQLDGGSLYTTKYAGMLISCVHCLVLGNIWIWFAEFIGHCRQW